MLQDTLFTLFQLLHVSYHLPPPAYTSSPLSRAGHVVLTGWAVSSWSKARTSVRRGEDNTVGYWVAVVGAWAWWCRNNFHHDNKVVRRIGRKGRDGWRRGVWMWIYIVILTMGTLALDEVVNLIMKYGWRGVLEGATQRQIAAVKGRKPDQDTLQQVRDAECMICLARTSASCADPAAVSTDQDASCCNGRSLERMRSPSLESFCDISTHLSHPGCIYTWISQNASANTTPTCPMCRRTLAYEPIYGGYQLPHGMTERLLVTIGCVLGISAGGMVRGFLQGLIV
ncbi:hypothetical protein BC832DRAFT_129155 [Gaertneriomyces semiglobifer]|nr:hypothetical protein BC832DRAFT_129155 [Gaertneriomyces semiglobifer]